MRSCCYCWLLLLLLIILIRFSDIIMGDNQEVNKSARTIEFNGISAIHNWSPLEDLHYTTRHEEARSTEETRRVRREHAMKQMGMPVSPLWDPYLKEEAASQGLWDSSNISQD